MLTRRLKERDVLFIFMLNISTVKIKGYSDFTLWCEIDFSDTSANLKTSMCLQDIKEFFFNYVPCQLAKELFQNKKQF